MELADSEIKCPLCGTEVINPNKRAVKDAKMLYPPYHPHTVQNVSRSSVASLLSLIILIPVLLALVCDASLNGRIVWSGYVIGAFAIIYINTVIPIAAHKFKPLIFLPLDSLAVSAFLYYIEFATGGSWFFVFALPVTLSAFFIIILISSLSLYTGISRLFISAVGLVCTGLFCLEIELLLNYAFSVRDRIAWSVYPLVTLILLGAILFLIDRNKPLKEKLERKFFI